MLKQILDRLRDSNEPVNLADLSRELGVVRSALDGMLMQLVRQGKLRDVLQAPGEDCGHCSGCASGHGSPIEVKAYEVIA